VAVRTNPNVSFERLRYAAAQARLPFDREAWLNLAFFLDEQYVDWDQDAKTIREIPRPKDEQNLPRPVVNKIMHYVQSAHATVLSDKPSADVLPADDEILSIGDASLSKAYCTYVSEPTNANWDRQLTRAALWALIAGNGWIKWTWSEKLERPDIIPPSYFEVFLDPYAKEFSKARYAIHSQFMDREQVYELWGEEIRGRRVRDRRPTARVAASGHGFCSGAQRRDRERDVGQAQPPPPQGPVRGLDRHTAAHPAAGPALRAPQTAAADCRSPTSAASSAPTRCGIARRSATCARRRCCSTSTTPRRS
jgi:hypothetical protein